MTTHFKITANLLATITDDLVRPHPFALERVGFLFARIGTAASDTLLILANNYKPTPDDLYIDDPSTGARINSTAIRNNLQNVIDTGMSAFHVHFHPFPGSPHFSITDDDSLARLIPAFHNANPNVPHGAILLGREGIEGRIWVTKDNPTRINRISIIGYPCNFMKRWTRDNRSL